MVSNGNPVRDMDASVRRTSSLTALSNLSSTSVRGLSWRISSFSKDIVWAWEEWIIFFGEEITQQVG